MYEKLLASEEQLMLPLIRRSQKGTKLNLPEYFHQQLLSQENEEQNKRCQIRILNQNHNKHSNTSNKNPSNSKLTTGSPALVKLQNCLRESSENPLQSLYEPCVVQDKKYIMEAMQSELKSCQIWQDYPAKSVSKKAIDDMLSKIPGKKHNSSQGSNPHIMNDNISESMDNTFLHICHSKDQKSESSFLQLFPTDTLKKPLSASSEFQPLHKRLSVSYFNSNFDSINMDCKTTEVSVKREDTALKDSVKDRKQNSKNKAKKLYNDTLMATPRHYKTNINDIYVPQKLSNFDKNCKNAISKGVKNVENNNTALATGYKECSHTCDLPVVNISSAEIMHMYGNLFRELGIEPEGLAPIKKHQKYKHN